MGNKIISTTIQYNFCEINWEKIGVEEINVDKE